ncbi:Stk1 family PASTA domain-containing Ser/Thr kinase [Streptomyces gramineus]|uniref:Stk1 family PASTA domain-containing Ser/Thr kinase n=1 Tax=Streptomyces gramineus TaxID=910542 RepID=UPI00398AE298
MEEPRCLNDRYELGRMLARGGMAEVHLAHDTRLGRTVAVKTLRADLARDPSFQARFRREAQSAASLNHPAIVAVYDTDEDEIDHVPVPYIVMEHVDGSTLRQLQQSGRELMPERSLELTTGILRGLEYAHRNGIVHRDVKPANVMVTRDGQVKVMDFGIARAMADSGTALTQISAVVGTAQYLSPEQARGRPVDARSDLYSTGCLLYELLAGRPPFVGDSPLGVAYHHVYEEPRPPSDFGSGITPGMDAIVLKALLKQPALRYQSADEMRTDLEACLEGLPVTATAALSAVDHDEDRTPKAKTPLADSGVPSQPVHEDGDGDDGSGHRTDRERPDRRTSGIPLVAVALAGAAVLVGAILLGPWATDGRAGRAGGGSAGGGGAGAGRAVSGDVATPDFVREPPAAAEGIARRSGLRVAFEQQLCQSQSHGRVCDQYPPAGTRIARGSTVTLVVPVDREASSDAPRVTVPRVTGMSVEDATAKLAAGPYAFEVRRQVRESGQHAGTVLEQHPSAGTEVQKSATVTLVVAGAAESRAPVTVPDVVGLTCEKATALMRAEGLAGHCAKRTTDDPDRVGEVISTTPGANQQVARKTEVRMFIGVARRETGQVAVPDLDGEPLSTARVLLRQAGLTVGDISGSQDPRSRVVFSDPSEGTRVDRARAVGLVTIGPITVGPDDEDDW